MADELSQYVNRLINDVRESPRSVADERIPQSKAGYMELVGARKDGDCERVSVADGISRLRGCCNEFQPETKSTTQFRCGTCEYVTGKKTVNRYDWKERK